MTERQLWTPREDAALLKLLRAGKVMPEIVAALGRDPIGIRNRTYRMRVAGRNVPMMCRERKGLRKAVAAKPPVNRAPSRDESDAMWAAAYAREIAARGLTDAGRARLTPSPERTDHV